MVKQRWLLMTLIFFCVAPLALAEQGRARQRARQGSRDSDMRTTKTITHIEYNRFGFMKMEFPRLDPDLEQDKPTKQVPEQDKEPQVRKTEKRTDITIMEVGPFCLFKHRDQGQGQYYQNWGDLMLADIYERRKMNDSKTVKFLEAPLVLGYQRHKKDNGELKTKLIDVPFFGLYSHYRQSDGDDDWTFGQAPMASLLKRRKSEKSSSISFCEVIGISLLKYENRNGNSRLRVLIF